MINCKRPVHSVADLPKRLGLGILLIVVEPVNWHVKIFNLWNNIRGKSDCIYLFIVQSFCYS